MTIGPQLPQPSMAVASSIDGGDNEETTEATTTSLSDKLANEVIDGVAANSGIYIDNFILLNCPMGI